MGVNLFYVFKGINFEVKEGEMVVIMGFLGFGKFIFFNIIGMFDEVDSGMYIFDGKIIKNLNEKIVVKYWN